MKKLNAFRSPLALAILVACYSNIAVADDNNQQQSAKLLDTLYIEAVDGYSATGITGLDLTQKEIPQSVTVIDKALIKNLQLNNLEQALSYTTGINTNVDSGRVRFQARGFYIDNIQEDGVSNSVSSSVNGPYGHSKEVSDMAFYEHVEVLRGVAGLAQSNGQPGGTVNLVRKKPTEEFQANANISAGSWESKRTMFDISGPITPYARARLVTVWSDKNSFKDLVYDTRYGALGDVEFDLGQKTTLNLGVIYQKDEGVLDNYGIPVLQTDGTTKSSLDLPRSTYSGLTWSGQNYEKTNAFGELRHDFNEDWKTSFKLNYTKSNGDIRIGALAGTDPYNEATNTHTLRKLRYTNSSDEWAAKFDLTGGFDLFGRKHNVFVNLSASKEEFTERDRWVANISGQSIYNFDRQQSEPDWANTASLSRDTKYFVDVNQFAAVTGTRLAILDNLHLLLGGRYSQVEYKRHNHNYRTGVTSATNVYKKSKFTPYAGLTFAFLPDHTAYISYAEIFKPQSNKRVGDILLDPLIGKNIETGIKSEWRNGQVNSSIALFQVTEQNRALYDAVNSTNTTDYYTPDGKIRTRGLDVEVNGNLTDNWLMQAGYTYSKSEYMTSENAGTGATDYRKGQSANRYTPKHMFRVYTQYQLPNQFDKWTVGTALRYQTKTASIYKDTVVYAAPEQKAYMLWDALIKYQVNPQTSILAGVKNITDKKYLMNTRNRTAGMNNYYGDPRSFYISLDWKY